MMSQPIDRERQWGAVEWDHALTIADLEIRRRFRTIRDNVWQLIAITMMALLFVPIGAFLLFGLYAFGSGTVDGTIDSPLEWARMAIVGVWTFVVLFGGYRAYSIALQPDRLPGLLTTVGPRELIAGLVIAELLMWGAIALAVGLLGATAFAAGAGAGLAVPLFLVAIFGLLLTGLLLGFIVALVIRNLGVRSVLLTRLRNALLVLLFLSYLAILMSGAFDDLFGPVVAIVAPTPVGWYADIVFLAVLLEASAARAIGAVGASIGAIVLFWAIVHRLASALWYADGVSVTRRTNGTTGGSSRLETILPRAVTGVAVVDWTRARRAPIALSFALYPLILLVGPFTDTVQTGTVGARFPMWIMVCGAWVTGVLFTLNILGNEAPTLEGTILSRNAGRGLVLGHVFAALLVAGLPTVLVTTAVAIVSPHTGVGIVLIGTTSVVLVVTAALIAPGIGVAVPRFEEVSITRGTQAIVPSWIAFGIYSFVLLILSLPALVCLLFLDSIGPSFAIAGVIISSIAGLGTGMVSTSRAIHRIDNYVFA